MVRKGKLLMIICTALLGATTSCKTITQKNQQLADADLQKAMNLVDKTIDNHFDKEMKMARFYNPHTCEALDEIGSVWMYSAGIESINAILHALKAQKDVGNKAVYAQNFEKYSMLLAEMYDKADYYLGTFELTSFTQTKEWTVYGVNRGTEKGIAAVAGIMNVYDDQMWLIRELVESYKLTDEKKYLELAEYLTDYVLDSWDCTIDENGQERGGITWGPGYVSKHACSNAPMISPLVWLSELYEGKDNEITYNYIDKKDGVTRKKKTIKKSEYYLDFAKRTYDWQKKYLLRSKDGVY